ncbi:MAG: polyprenyl synthetase family protein [Desulfarculus sp.]|nr:polyprenyl synthetase family protein [Desulfarculus sp.]MBV1740113.1 polyprenyl synthetase family protein [Desulfarculus sp.]MBV1750754.1 polyprenyl synthetase family protein [Desulfarculus sp.]
MVDAALERLLPADENGGRILEAMRYSIFAGGKRLRPILCLAGAEAVGGDPAQVMFCACAMEMVHTYSLIHDDLPAMDDDEFRRGVPTSHMVYGEGMAVLAGDGLLTQAMVLLSDPAETAGLDPSRVLEAAQVVMKAAGYVGMVGGQAVDLASENLRPDLATVQYMHAMKTGALITASVQSGAILAGGDADQVRQLVRYGRRIGLAFQIADDLLDLEGDFDALGKTVGADQARGKMTYPAVVGPAQARSMGQGLVDQAAEIAESLGPQAAPLAELARYIMARTH